MIPPTLITPITEQDKILLLRRKSAMVLYELEMALGEFVRTEKLTTADLPIEAVTKIQLREEAAGRVLDASTPSGVIAATYLGEALALAHDAAKGRPEEEHLARLKQLFNALDIFNIRNAISHPNKPFHPCYWYRIAAIAIDPIIDKLQFRKVMSAFYDAESGRLFSPPEEWMNRPIWSIPNNLPKQFDHAITGLIGRVNQVRELKKALQKKSLPLIALVAPGGIGKTSLLLEVLNELVHSPESAEWVEQVLYFTSKTESLTPNGIVTQASSAATIEDIKSSITRLFAEQEGVDDFTFEEVCQKFYQRKILLCLDNLETLLRDDSVAFDDFYLDRPDSWRVVVTSRIAVNGAYTISINSLDVGGATGLANSYLLKRGGPRLSDTEVENLVQACDLIPLAIRLSIDGFIAGASPLQAQSTVKGQILEFSYRNLINALSNAAREVLECLFVTTPEPISRLRASSLLQRNEDEIAEAFRQLQGTSLVTRVPDQVEESYILSSSVRDLLLVSPIDLSIRGSIQKNLQRIAQTLSEIRNQRRVQKGNPLSKAYLPEITPEPLQVIAADALHELNRYTLDRYRLSEILNDVRQAITTYSNQPILHRIRGLILLKLDDRSQGKLALRQAWEMEPADVASGLLLANELRADNDLKEAKDVAEQLIQLGWDNPEKSDRNLASLVIKNYWLPLIWLGETEKAIEATKNWYKEGLLRGTYGFLRSQALRQSASYGTVRNVYRGMCEAVDILDEIFNIEGYAGVYVDEGMKLIKEFIYKIKARNEPSEDEKLKVIQFVDKHLTLMCQVHNNYSLDHPDVQSWIRTLVSLKKEENPLLSERWKSSVENTISPSSILESREEELDWLRVKVYYRPTLTTGGLHKPFLFAEDETNKRQYYIHRENLGSADKIWTTIQVGDWLKILPDIPEEDGKAIKVRQAKFVNKLSDRPKRSNTSVNSKDKNK